MSFLDDFRAILLNLSARDVDALHHNADTDQSRRALHHTLGNKGSQAAPGNHTHDGNDSPQLDLSNLTGDLPLSRTTENLPAGRLDGGTVSGDLTMPKIRLTSTSDASPTSTAHAFQIGADDAPNVVIDNNEIMARNNGVATQLNVNISGGDVVVGDSTSRVTIAGHVDSPNLPWAVAANAVVLTVASKVTGSATVTFPVGRFTQAPMVAATVRTGAPAQRAVGVSDPTTSGFTMFLYNDAGGSITNSIGWIAMQMTSSSAGG